jgi:hypothetical protein
LLIQSTGFEIRRYGPVFRVSARNPAITLARKIRYLFRDLLGAFLNFVFSSDIPFDPVVVLVLRKKL